MTFTSFTFQESLEELHRFVGTKVPPLCHPASKIHHTKQERSKKTSWKKFITLYPGRKIRIFQNVANYICLLKAV